MTLHRGFDSPMWRRACSIEKWTRKLVWVSTVCVAFDARNVLKIHEWFDQNRRFKVRNLGLKMSDNLQEKKKEFKMQHENFSLWKFRSQQSENPSHGAERFWVRSSSNLGTCGSFLCKRQRSRLVNRRVLWWTPAADPKWDLNKMFWSRVGKDYDTILWVEYVKS